MSRRSLFFLSSAAVAASTAGLIYALRRQLHVPLPGKRERFILAALQGPVEILRDRWGVPHIYASNTHDLFFAQGFVHAQDRLFQMDTFRRVGAGRISELVGPPGLAIDRFARYLGWRRVAEAQVAHAGAEVQQMMGAYCAGVNAYIDRKRLPVEFTLLAYRPEPWQFVDSALWGTVLSWGLSVNWETELLRSLLVNALGAQKTAELTNLYGQDYQTIFPDARVGERLSQALVDSYQQALLTMPLGNVPAGRGVGSNNWVVSGQHTASGRPILANDPHLPPIFPPFWYENHLCGGEFNVTGFSMPGVPGVVIGHNDNVAWGVTSAYTDVQDIYIERFHAADPTLYEVNGRWQKAELIAEEIKVRAGKTVLETVRYTRHGPVFSDLIPHPEGDLALRWSSHSSTNQMRAFLDMNRATCWEEFRESLRPWSFASLNIVYADVSGLIGYVMPGLVPRRRRGVGAVPVPGWSDDYEWDSWIPLEELPQLTNPPEGMIVTANNHVHGADYPYLLTSEWLPDYRAKRIWQLLRNELPLSVQANGRIQTDAVSLPLQRFLRAALPYAADFSAIDAETRRHLDRLRAWNGHMAAELVEPSLAHGWLVYFVRAAIAQAVGAELASALLNESRPEMFPLEPFFDVATELALNWLEQGCPSWAGDVAPLLEPALLKTVRSLRRRLGKNHSAWQWGKIHRIELSHPLARIPGLGRVWKPMSLAADGDGYTVNQSEVGLQFPPKPVTIIASCRLIIDVGEWDNSLAVLPGGQSGHPASAHYQDGLGDWQNGRYHPHLFSRARVAEEMESKTILEPGGSLALD